MRTYIRPIISLNEIVYACFSQLFYGSVLSIVNVIWWCSNHCHEDNLIKMREELNRRSPRHSVNDCCYLDLRSFLEYRWLLNKCCLIQVFRQSLSSHLPRTTHSCAQVFLNFGDLLEHAIGNFISFAPCACRKWACSIIFKTIPNL